MSTINGTWHCLELNRCIKNVHYITDILTYSMLYILSLPNQAWLRKCRLIIFWYQLYLITCSFLISASFPCLATQVAVKTDHKTAVNPAGIYFNANADWTIDKILVFEQILNIAKSMSDALRLFWDITSCQSSVCITVISMFNNLFFLAQHRNFKQMH